MMTRRLAALVFVLFSVVLAGPARAEGAPPVASRFVLRAVTGFPDMVGLELGARPFGARYDLEVGAGAGPFVARAHLHMGPSFLLADSRGEDGSGWEVGWLLRAGGSICAGAAGDDLESAGCAEAGLGVEATRWTRAGYGLNLRLLGGAGYVVGGPKLGVTAYPIVAASVGLAL